VDLLKRVRSRSGELTFDPQVDASEDVNEPRHRWIDALVPFVDRDVIDFGCWTAGLLRHARSAGARRVAGLDLPGPWLETAQAMTPEADIRRVESFSPLPASLRASFDVAFLLETLEHVPRGTESQVLDAVFEALRPGGTLVLSTPTAGLAAILDPAWWLVGHRHYRDATVLSLVTNAGYQSAELRFSGNLWTSADTLWMYLDKHIMHRPHRPPALVTRRLDTGMTPSREIGSTTVWVIASKAPSRG
jgi:SAM-dependent methyltransferase